MTLMSAALMRIIGSAGNFLLLLIVSRLYGPEATGIYYSAVSVGYITSQIMNFGLNRYTLRYINYSQERDSFDGIKTIGAIVSILPMLLALFLYLVMPLYIRDIQVIYGYIIGCCLGSTLSIQTVSADLLKVRNRPSLALLVENSALPWLATLGVWLASNWTTSTIVPTQTILASSAVISATLLFLRVGGKLSFSLMVIRDLAIEMHSRQGQLIVFWLTAIAVMIASRIPSAIAPLMMPAEQVGILVASIGIASLGGTMIQAAQAYFAPKFSVAYSTRNSRALVRHWIASCGMTTMMFLPILMTCLFNPKWVLGFFGKEFQDGDPNILLAMVIGQGIRMMTGNSEIFLSMIDQEKKELAVLIISSFLFILLVLILDSVDAPLRVAVSYGAMLVARSILSGSLCLSSVFRMSHEKPGA